jgi:hypothetical protein
LHQAQSGQLPVLEKFSEDFELEDFGSDNKQVRLRFSGKPSPGMPAVADVLMPASVPQAADDKPRELLSNILDAETLNELRFKPAAPGMGSRRNGRAVMRGDRVRARRPLVQLS